MPGSPRGRAPVSFILPRWLRRPVRLIGRVTTGEVEPPRFAALSASAAVLLGFAAYGAYLGGHVPQIMQSVTARTGLAVDSIRIVGNRETSELDVIDRLALDGWTSLVGYDADDARERISSLPWVQAAAVRKIYPDTLEVRLEEKVPFALWQQGAEVSIIEEDGAVIAPFTGGHHASLPLVVGAGAEKHAAAFVRAVAQVPAIASRVRAYVRVADRRWDLRLDNGVTLRLPETGETAAIAELVALDREQSLLSRDIVAVDMRLQDRVVVQLTPDAVERREAALKEAEKAAKRKAGRRA